MKICKYLMFMLTCVLLVSCSNNAKKDIITITHIKEDLFDYKVDLSEVKATSISFYIDYYKGGKLVEKREEITGHPVDNNYQVFIHFIIDKEKSEKKDYWIWESHIEKKYGQGETAISEFKKNPRTIYKKTFISNVVVGKNETATLGYIAGNNNDELYVLRCIIYTK